MQLIITGRHAACSGAGAAGSEWRTAGQQHVQSRSASPPFQRAQRRRLERVVIRAGNGGKEELAALDDGVVQAVRSLRGHNNADASSDVMESAQPDATSDERQRLLVSK